MAGQLAQGQDGSDQRCDRQKLRGEVGQSQDRIAQQRREGPVGSIQHVVAALQQLEAQQDGNHPEQNQQEPGGEQAGDVAA